MSAVQAVIDRIRRDYLTQGRVEPRNKLSASIDASQTTLTFAYDLDALVAGGTISIGLEDMHVWSVDSTARSIEVDRGIDSSTASAHTTAERVRVAPRWTDAQILRSMNAELANLYAQGLYGVTATEVTFSANTQGYPLPAACIAAHRVMVQDYTGDNWFPLNGWTVEHNQNTTDFPSGVALFLRGDAGLEGRKLRVIYKRTFAELTALDDDVVTDGLLPSTAVDVLAMGTAVNVLVGREVANRLYETQGSTRRGEETPPGSVAQSFTPIIRQYQARLQAEKRALARRYGAL